MGYSFVTARILGRQSMHWVRSQSGLQVADSLDTRPFIALKAPSSEFKYHDLGYDAIFPEETLIPVSPDRPPHWTPYFVPIWPHVDGPRPPIRITPPLPFPQKLYFYTGRLFIMSTQPDPSEHCSKYVVDPDDLKRLFEYAAEDNRADGYREGALDKRVNARSGGGEAVRSDWSSFSGDEPYESMNQPPNWPGQLELGVMEDLKVLESVSVLLEEVAALKRIGKAYSWVGVSATLGWVMDCHKTKAILTSNFPNPLNRSGEDTPISRLAVLGTAAADLFALTVSWDGEVPATVPSHIPQEFGSEHNQNHDYVDDEDWYPDFVMAPEIVIQDRTDQIRVICFDVYGTLVDREGGLSEAISCHLKPGEIRWSPSEGFHRYTEQEAHLLLSGVQAEYTDIVQTALQKLSQLMGIRAEDAASVAVSDWQVWTEVHQAMKTLKSRGYRLVALPNVDTQTFKALCPKLETDGFAFDEVIETSDAKGLCMQVPAVYAEVVRRCSEAFDVTASQILVVSSGAYRCIEPCAMLGMPTAWLRRDARLEGSEELEAIVSAQPTLKVNSLAELCEVLSVLDTENDEFV